VKVRIDANGREVEIECGDAGTSFREVADKALEVWAGTEGAPAGEGPAYGFQTERRPFQVSPMNLGGHGGAYIVEPRATDEPVAGSSRSGRATPG
jgi:hypothetical protein